MAVSPSLFSKEYLDVQRSRRKSKDVKAPEGSRHPSTESPGNMRGGPDANIQEQVDKKKENIQGHESIVHGIVDEIISNAIEEAETSEADEMVDILLSLVMENAKEPGGWREASEKTAGEKADAEKKSPIDAKTLSLVKIRIKQFEIAQEKERERIQKIREADEKRHNKAQVDKFINELIGEALEDAKEPGGWLETKEKPQKIIKEKNNP